MIVPLPVGTDRRKLNVFISYSRQDSEFSDQLVAALDAVGFATTIDRKGIHGAENWERRLRQLILESDTVVFVLTPRSAASSVCQWEVAQALELKKRIVPVVASPLGPAQPHERLRDLNYIYFYSEPAVPGSGFGSGLAHLIASLSVDVEWTREHTRLGTLASRWHADNRPADLLLRGSELARLQRWRDTRPANAPELTALQRAFLQTSEDEESARASEERRQLEERQRALKQAEQAQEERAATLKQLSRRTKYGMAGLFVLAVLSCFAAAIAYTQNQALQGASLRLRDGMTLKIADTDHAVTSTEKWYRIATEYKLAIGVYRDPRVGPGKEGQVGTGFLVNGGSLRAEWTDQVVFMTASHVLRAYWQDVAPDISRAEIVFPGIERAAPLGVEEVLFDSRTADLDVAVLRLRGALSRHAVPVDLSSQIESKDALGGIAVLHWTGQDGFALGFGHGVAKPNPDMGAGEGRMYYTHVTGGGASGAPVFDTSSGNVVCLHVGGNARSPRPVGYCVSMSKIVAAIGA